MTIQEKPKWICTECHNAIATGDIKGSMKYPYCNKYFENVWNGDYKEYLKWLEKETRL